jgi:hypothetical protein
MRVRRRARPRTPARGGRGRSVCVMVGGGPTTSPVVAPSAAWGPARARFAALASNLGTQQVFALSRPMRKSSATRSATPAP